RAGATHREPHAPPLLEYVNKRVDRGALKRITADQQRVEAEDLLKTLVLKVSLREVSHGAIGTEAHELWKHAHHVDDARERPIDQRKRAIEDALGGSRESIVAVHVRRVEATDLVLQPLLVARIAEDRAVLESHVIE